MIEPSGLLGSSRKIRRREILAAYRAYHRRPDQEALDPVRFLSNHSSGRMGYALARAAQKGART